MLGERFSNKYRSGRKKIRTKNESSALRGLLSPPPLVLKIGRYLPTLIFMGLVVNLILPQIASVESAHVIKTMIPWAVLLAALGQGVSYLVAGSLIMQTQIT